MTVQDDNTYEVQKLLAQNLKRVRVKLGLTQMKLAELCSVSTSFIGEIEICRKFPSASTLQRLVDSLGIHPIELFQDAEEGVEAVNSPYSEIREIKLLRKIQLHIQKEFDVAILSLKKRTH